jgi:predicted SAM-dependent methyltransferase
MEGDIGKSRGINIGCGEKYWEGWVNLDISKTRPKLDVVADARVLPFKDESFDILISVHVLEHFFLHEAVEMLKEWKRVLKMGGLFIVEIPCMDKVFGYIAYCIKNKLQLDPQFSYYPIWGIYENQGLKNESTSHKWGYTKSDLKNLLNHVGYKDVINRQARYGIPMRDMRFEATK